MGNSNLSDAHDLFDQLNLEIESLFGERHSNVYKLTESCRNLPEKPKPNTDDLEIIGKCRFQGENLNDGQSPIIEVGEYYTYVFRNNSRFNDWQDPITKNPESGILYVAFGKAKFRDDVRNKNLVGNKLELHPAFGDQLQAEGPGFIRFYLERAEGAADLIGMGVPINRPQPSLVAGRHPLSESAYPVCNYWL